MRLTALLLVGFLPFAVVSRAVGQSDTVSTPASRESIQRLFFVTRTGMFHGQMLQLAKARYAENPLLAPFADTLVALLQKHAPFSAMEDDLIKLYREAYTEEDVVALVSFYETPLGQRLVAATPMISAKFATIASDRMNALIPQLMKELGLPPSN